MLMLGELNLTWGLDGWIIMLGILSAVGCALVGNFLVLRKMSMMGDAISHAVLPGIAIAFFMTGSRSSFPMFVGAMVVGMLTAVFVQWIHQWGKVERSASMGVVFTSLFALGLVLIVKAADHVDLDASCVLYGAIELAAIDTVSVGSWEVPRAAINLSAIVLINLVFVLVMFKEWRIALFDPALATTQGVNASFMHYLLMALVAMTTVGAFESVGSILVIAMLIVPPAAAYLLTDKFHLMIVLSVLIAAGSAVLGHLSAITVPGWFGFVTVQADGSVQSISTQTAGMIAVVAGLLFVLALLLGPRHGLVSKVYHRLRLTLRIYHEDVLGLLYRAHEESGGEGGAKGEVMTLDELNEQVDFPGWMRRWILRDLKRNQQIRIKGERIMLTDSGRRRARQLIRSHRLWETYLHENMNVPVESLHDPAHRLEHVTDPVLRMALVSDIEARIEDPQGKSIPPEDSIDHASEK